MATVRRASEPPTERPGNSKSVKKKFLVTVRASMMAPSMVKQLPPETMKMAAVVVATLPVLVVYPFLQKYFLNGMLIGAIKG